MQRLGRIFSPRTGMHAALLLAGCGDSSLSTPNNPQPALAFVAPAVGATAQVGKPITITLDVTNAAAFTQSIFVVGQGQLGTVEMPTAAPYTATLSVPANLPLGNYTLTAVGQTASSATPITVSTTIAIVSNPEIPVDLQLPQGGLTFTAIGERLPITVPGATKGLDYTSDAPNIATVSAAGIVIAQQAGDTTITVSLNKAIVGSVPVKVLAPALLPAPVQLGFGDQAKGTQSASQDVTLTNNTTYPVSVLEVKSGTVFPTTGNCIASSPLAPGAFCTLSVNFAPTTTGSVNGVLMIVGSAVIAPTRILVSGNGT